MSDLYIQFDETYDAPVAETLSRLSAIARAYKITYDAVADAYYEYLDSDQFYIERGI
jgi:hypothetical protein